MFNNHHKQETKVIAGAIDLESTTNIENILNITMAELPTNIEAAMADSSSEDLQVATQLSIRHPYSKTVKISKVQVKTSVPMIPLNFTTDIK